MDTRVTGQIPPVRRSRALRHQEMPRGLQIYIHMRIHSGMVACMESLGQGLFFFEVVDPFSGDIMNPTML